MKARIYTKTGDKGETSLVGGARVSKADPRLEAYGTLDELNSFVGLLRTESKIADARLQEIQNNLFNVGSHLACEDRKILQGLPTLSAALERALESDMDVWESALPPLKEFILPGGSRGAAYAHVCRTICRRVERLVVGLRREGVEIEDAQVIFLNRLSDWFFLLARKLNADANEKDVTWRKS